MVPRSPNQLERHLTNPAGSDLIRAVFSPVVFLFFFFVFLILCTFYTIISSQKLIELCTAVTVSDGAKIVKTF